MKYPPIINVERDPNDPNRIIASGPAIDTLVNVVNAAKVETMTWREGVNYWRAWAQRTDGDVIEDAGRITRFYEAMVDHNKASALRLDDPMPPELVTALGMDR